MKIAIWIIVIVPILKVEAQTCRAIFSWQPDTIPSNVIFNDTSHGNVTSRLWDFGDSSSSTLPHVIHHYSVPGVYSVCLRITDSTNGCTNTFCDTIEAIGTCKTHMFSFPTATPNSIKFCDMPFNIPYFPSFWHWDFDDGVTSNVRLPAHTYNTSGIYNVCLTAYDSSVLCYWKVCKPVKVEEVLSNTSISVCDGYWSDPFTWNTGAVPSSTDSVFIFNHVVMDTDVTVVSPGFIYIEENSSLCGHHNLTSAIITYGVLNVNHLTICDSDSAVEDLSYSDFIPVNSLNGVFTGCLTGTNSWVTQYWPSSSPFSCNVPLPCSTGINENKFEENLVSVSPNPSSTDSWQLTVGNNLIGAVVEIFDVNGKVVFQSEISNPKSEINFNAARGVYLLRISSAKQSVVRKLVRL